MLLLLRVENIYGTLYRLMYVYVYIKTRILSSTLFTANRDFIIARRALFIYIYITVRLYSTPVSVRRDIIYTSPSHRCHPVAILLRLYVLFFIRSVPSGRVCSSIPSLVRLSSIGFTVSGLEQFSGHPFTVVSLCIHIYIYVWISFCSASYYTGRTFDGRFPSKTDLSD